MWKGQKQRERERRERVGRRAGVQSEGQISLDSCSVCSGPTTSTCITAATSHMTTTGDGASITHTNDKNWSRVNRSKHRMLLPLKAAGGTADAIILSHKHLMTFKYWECICLAAALFVLQAQKLTYCQILIFLSLIIIAINYYCWMFMFFYIF